MRGYIDLSNRAKLRLTGGDRERYLNGQVTNDVRKATSESAIYACVTNAKGKLQADIFVSATPDGDALLIDGPPGLEEELFARLDMYIIADDAELEDVTPKLRLVHVLGEPDFKPDGVWLRKSNRFGEDGLDLIGENLPDLDLPEISHDELEALRISRGIGVWGAELTSERLPQEANLQDRAIDFYKGCYIGQEVISRIKSVGRVNRQIVALVAQDQDTTLTPGTTLKSDDKDVGEITSAAYDSALERPIALALVKRGHNDPGTLLTAENVEKPLEIRETPLT